MKQESSAPIQCFKHYCRNCHAMEFVPRANSGSEYPRCCQKPMAYLGVVDAIPGRDKSLMRKGTA